MRDDPDTFAPCQNEHRDIEDALSEQMGELCDIAIRAVELPENLTRQDAKALGWGFLMAAKCLTERSLLS